MVENKNSAYFHCKQFYIRHDIASLKVTTEALILGAYAATNSEKDDKILDIGTGTGLLPLMISQKTNAKIDAVEIDSNSYLLAQENIQKSKYYNQIQLHHIDIQSFISPYRFNLIVSNPPFFKQHLKSNSESKNLAIHNDRLPFYDLAKAVFDNLQKTGKFIVLFPPHQLQLLETELSAFGLNKVKEFLIHHKLNSKVLRIIATFEYNLKEFSSDTFFVKDQSENYTKQFQSLLRDYYVIF